MRTFIAKLFIALLCFGVAFKVVADDSLVRREWKIDGVTREALVHIPDNAKTNPAPVVFAFHGHSGTMQSAARSFRYHTIWPEAIVVYMQGLKTPGRLTDPEGKLSGWQPSAGDQNDRDLKFFDAVLASLKKDYKVDAKRIYATGHSNGGSFTYLLWETRGKEFAAFAPSAAVSRTLVENGGGVSRRTNATNSVSSKKEFVPKPVFHVAGENDPLVKFAWQKLMIDALRKLNQCAEGKPWKADKSCTIYASKVNAPVVTFIHPGTHKFPSKAPEKIVKFFKEHALP